ncbi:MAG: hypothetical protein GVY36_14630 [Verrucomicrobia bacterium]|jgi:hypothetical protein|nr:hypothetical protein [Verrucomicrobiota bacterium]
MNCIDLNDSGIRLQTGAGDNETAGPGMASLDDGGEWIFGAAARANARLTPGETVAGFWDRPGEPDRAVDGRLPGLTVGEAVRTQLAALPVEHVSGEATVLLMPSFYTEEDRRALRTLADEAGFPSATCVDVALAAFLANRDRIGSGRPECFYLDATLGRLVLARLDVSAESVRVAGAWTEDGFGAARLEESVFLKADKLCLEQMRIRPSKKGATDQALFDQIPEALAALSRGGVAIFEIGARKAEMAGSDFEEAFGDLAEILVAFVRRTIREQGAGGKDAPLLLSPRISRIPGAVDHLARVADIAPVDCSEEGRDVLDGGSLWRNASPGSGSDSGEASAVEIRFDADHAGDESGPLEPDSPAADDGGRNGGRHYHTGKDGFLDGPPPKPTHLLFQGRVLPLEVGAFRIGRGLTAEESGLRIVHAIPEVAERHCELRVEADGAVRLADWGDGRVWVNDRPAEPGQALETGDYLGIGGHKVELMCVAVTGMDGR